MPDELLALRRLVAPSHPDPGTAHSAEERLRAHIATRSRPPSAGRPRPTRRRRWALIAGVPAGALAIAGTAVALTTAKPAPTAGIGCFDTPSRQADVAVLGHGNIPNPIAACASLYRGGEMGAPRQAPPLVACVQDGGAINVFPSSDRGICRRLGLQPWRRPTAGPGGAG